MIFKIAGNDLYQLRRDVICTYKIVNLFKKRHIMILFDFFTIIIHLSAGTNSNLPFFIIRFLSSVNFFT